MVHNPAMKPVKPLGPEAQLQAIYAAVRALAPGQVSTYGGIAARAGLPGRARLVGFALRTAPDDMGLPWHRVVGAGGRIAFPSGTEAAARQAALLRGEGVEVARRTVAKYRDALNIPSSARRRREKMSELHGV